MSVKIDFSWLFFLINIRGLLKARNIPAVKDQWFYLTHNWEDKIGSYLSQRSKSESECSCVTGS